MDSLNCWGSRKRSGGSSGWKQAAKVNCIVLTAMSATLVGGLIAASTTAGGIQQVLFFYNGGCDGGDVARLNLVLHLVINVVSTLVVILNAPSREELDKAHYKGAWFGIGIPSVRNAFMVSRFKTVCWFLLLASSIPIHLLFNSTIFQTDQRDSDFHMTIADEEFLNGGSFYGPGAGLVQAGFSYWPYLADVVEFHNYGTYWTGTFGMPVSLNDYKDKNSDAMKNISAIPSISKQWERLEVQDCKKEYISCSGLKRHRSVVLVVDKPGGWIRKDMWHLMNNQTDFWDSYMPADQQNHLFYSTQMIGSELTSGLQPGAVDLSVKYCLAEPIERICHVALSPTLLLAVTICVIFKTCTAIVVTIVLSRQNQAPLVTLGDAVESFIEKPDPVTAGMCTLGQAEIRRTVAFDRGFLVPGPKKWVWSQRRRAGVIPKSVWLMSYLLFALGISVIIYFFNDIRKSGPLAGSFLESELNSFLDTTYSFIQTVTIANSPQLLLSFCYLAYNNLFTRLQMAREWSLFGEGYQPLRVTDPKGDQYSTYRLQLPYKYSVPLIIVSVFLHWLLSNTIYTFISIGGYFGTDSFLLGRVVDPSFPPNTSFALGYSGWSLLVMLVVSLCLIFVPIGLSIKKLPPNMIAIGSNSLALSAACHASSLSYAVKARGKSVLFDSPTSSRFDLPPTLKPSSRSRTLSADENDEDTGVEMQNFTTISLQQSRQSLASKRSLLDRNERVSSEEDWDETDEQSSLFKKLARSKIRWGVVEMPPEWHAEWDNEDDVVEHLSFGVEEDDVMPPEPGRLYA
ncbi:hypothetical protein F5Y04DRAFT_288784 [Hypomontagnella monticulosa]|nr:hypothetical protein F5Y04DRAFT_288784 [Hypomontagnella monticulosa]